MKTSIKLLLLLFVILAASCGGDSETENNLLVGVWNLYELPSKQGNVTMKMIIDENGIIIIQSFSGGIHVQENDEKGTINFSQNVMTLVTSNKWDINVSGWVPKTYIKKTATTSYLSEALYTSGLGDAFIRDGSGSGVDGNWMSLATQYSNDVLNLQMYCNFSINGLGGVGNSV